MVMTIVRLVTQDPISETIESGYPISHSASFATRSRAQQVVVVLMNRSGGGVLRVKRFAITPQPLRFMSTTTTRYARESVAKLAEC